METSRFTGEKEPLAQAAPEFIYYLSLLVLLLFLKASNAES